MRVEEQSIAPAEAAFYGLAAGLTATLVISAVSRIPQLRQYAERSSWAHGSVSAAEEAALVTTPMSPGAVLVQASGPVPKALRDCSPRKCGRRDCSVRIWPLEPNRGGEPSTSPTEVCGASCTDAPNAKDSSSVALWRRAWFVRLGLRAGASGAGNETPARPSRSSRAQNAFIAAAPAVLYGVTVATMFSRLMCRPHEQPALHLRDRH